MSSLNQGANQPSRMSSPHALIPSQKAQLPFMSYTMKDYVQLRESWHGGRYTPSFRALGLSGMLVHVGLAAHMNFTKSGPPPTGAEGSLAVLGQLATFRALQRPHKLPSRYDIF